MSDNPGAIRSADFLFESTLDSVDAIEEVAVSAAREAGFAEDDLHKLGMAVREAAVNAVVHGNRYNLRKKVHLQLQTGPDRLGIVITDEGDGFELTELPDPLADENLLRQSGRGLLLIKAFVDEFGLRKAEPPLGTEVRLVFCKRREDTGDEK